MENFHLPHVVLPYEYCHLLKTNLSVSNSFTIILDKVASNKSLYCSVEKLFKKFDDGRGFEKTMSGLGWNNFRDRLGSIYLYRYLNGKFPTKIDLKLTDDIKQFENQFYHLEINGYSRLFLLGFYLKFANLLSKNKNVGSIGFKIPDEVDIILRLSKIKSEKIDWLILIVTHLIWGLGYNTLLTSIASGKKIDELYDLLEPRIRKIMFDNLLAYGTSIQEHDFFLYQKI
jgi:hypothetical protein